MKGGLIFSEKKIINDFKSSAALVISALRFNSAYTCDQMSKQLDKTDIYSIRRATHSESALTDRK